MGFHYAREKARFERKWETLKNQYEQAGMSKEIITAMYVYDWEYFCSQRTYLNHTQAFPDAYINDNDEVLNSTLIRKFDALCVTFDKESFSGRYAWVDTIENPELATALKNLSEKELELLTFLVIENRSQTELARKWNCSQNAISKQFLRLKKNFKEIFK